jgi:glycosyltransferase involved in cell wall biosynthesis
VPHIGGVEKQVSELSKRLIDKGFSVTIFTEKFENNLKKKEMIEGVRVIRISYPKIKYLGLIFIWLEMIRNIKAILTADIVHAHGIFVWYLPFRFIFPLKPVYTTFHGWEGIYPIPTKNIFLRKVGAALSWKYLCIGKFIEKHYRIKADNIYYTAVDVPKKDNYKKGDRTLLYVGRLDEDTGLVNILKCLRYLKGYEIIFCGNGSLASECKKFGKVCGFVDPASYYERAAICLSPGHTSILEAFTYKCLVITTYNNPVKRDYLKMTPFRKYIIIKKSPKKMAEMINYYSRYPEGAKSMIEGAYNWVATQNWNNTTRQYLKLWGVI